MGKKNIPPDGNNKKWNAFPDLENGTVISIQWFLSIPQKQLPQNYKRKAVKWSSKVIPSDIVQNQTEHGKAK